MSISFYPAARTDAANRNIHDRAAGDERLDLNLSNLNAAHILQLLGYEMEIEMALLEPFAARVQRALHAHPTSAATANRTETGNHATVIHFGRPADYDSRTLDRLAVFADAARDYGATHVRWC